jgi:hypothetical protein
MADKVITVTWNTNDVMHVRPDLTKDEAAGCRMPEILRHECRYQLGSH